MFAEFPFVHFDLNFPLSIAFAAKEKSKEETRDEMLATLRKKFSLVSVYKAPSSKANDGNFPGSYETFQQVRLSMTGLDGMLHLGWQWVI